MSDFFVNGKLTVLGQAFVALIVSTVLILFVPGCMFVIGSGRITKIDSQTNSITGTSNRLIHIQTKIHL